MKESIIKTIHASGKTAWGAAMLSLFLFSAKAQTLVTAPMTGTPAPGGYYGYNSINVNANFSFVPTVGQSLHLYIAPSDCQPLGSSPSNNQNYIMTTVPRIPNYDPLATGYSTCDVMQTIQYFDGLGRRLQTVHVKGSPDASKDIVEPFAYDAYGRQNIKYLPYAAASNDGSYKGDALMPATTTGLFAFYNPSGSTGTQLSGGIAHITFPYAETGYEQSPLNRVAEQGAPGDNWQLALNINAVSPGHTMKENYLLNATFPNTTGSVYWIIGYSVSFDVNGNPVLHNNGTYAPDQLTLTISKDENWIASDDKAGTVEEYKDKNDHTLVKRTYNNKSGTIETMSTYYVYDDYGNLTYVLPPAINPDAFSGNIDQTRLDTWCYQYRYDYRNRLVEKKIPGKGWEYMVYNPMDQLVLTQDASQRTHIDQEWTVVKYDRFGRAVITGIYKYTGSTAGTSYRTTMQANVNAPVTYPNPNWENRTTSGNGYINSSGLYNTYPYALNNILSISYFDDYNIPGIPGYAAPIGASTMTANLPTAKLVAVLNTIYNTTPVMLWQVYYYDNLGKIIKTYNQHYLGEVQHVNNYDAVLNTYNFNNQITTITRQHYTNTGTPGLKVTIANRYIYDHTGSKIKTWEQITNGANTPDITKRFLVSQTNYNDIGQTFHKSLHATNADSSTFRQTVTNNYNEHGWLAKSSAELFAEQLQYNTDTTKNGMTLVKQYNGNIAGQTYGTLTNPATNTYAYQYDKLNRLTDGSSSDNFNEKSIGYDLMGNITGLSRSTGSTAFTDVLAYNYTVGALNTNQLQTVTDGSTTANNDLGLTHGLNSYTYDTNGNLKTSVSANNPLKNVNITAYNLLNLPQAITTGTTSMTYIYDANGVKLRKISGTVTTDYIGGIQYIGITTTTPTISFIQTEEGRALANGATDYNYEYSLTDHLGNNRVTFDTYTGTTANLKQTDDYYSFGMEILRGTVPPLKNEYLYNNKELQEELGQYDYGARFYDPVIGRWTRIDDKAESFESITQYAYAVNDPVNAIDPDGKLIIFINGFVKGQWYNQNGKKTTLIPDRPFHPREVPNPEYRPYPGDRNFHTGSPSYVGKPFEYWENVDDAFKQGFNDNHALYVNASSENNSQGADRFAEGEAAGNNLISQLDAGKISLANAETIKIVSHSQGGAFAAGLATVLSKSKKYASILELVVYLEPHQPASFKHPKSIKGVQISAATDRVASIWNFLAWVKGKTSYSRIDGVQTFIPNDTHDDDDGWFGTHGHAVETNLDEIADYFSSKGVKIIIK